MTIASDGRGTAERGRPATGGAIGSVPVTAEDRIPEIVDGAAIVVRAAFSAGLQVRITAVSRRGRTIEVSSNTSPWRHSEDRFSHHASLRELRS